MALTLDLALDLAFTPAFAFTFAFALALVGLALASVQNVVLYHEDNVEDDGAEPESWGGMGGGMRMNYSRGIGNTVHAW